MAEQNNQAERAAPELLPCPFCGSTNIDPAEWSGNDGKSGPGCGECGALGESVEAWNRRAALPAAVDAEGLPPLPKVGPICYAMAADVQEYKVPRVGNHLPGVYDVALWSTDQFRNGQREAIAADRRKQVLTQPARIGSIEDYAQFHALHGMWLSTREYWQDDDAPQVLDAWRKFIDYIDDRSAPAAGTVEKDAARLEVFIDWYLREGKRSEINPNGHSTFTTREHIMKWLDAAIEAHNRAGKEQG